MSSRYWERQPRESATTYEDFCTYRDMGGSRTLPKVAEIRGKSLAAVAQSSQRHNWVERVQAYDDFLDMERRIAVEENERRRAIDLSERNRKIDQQYIEVRELMMKKALAIWNWPLSTREHTEYYEDGREKKIVIRPARWSFNTGVNLAERLDPTPESSLSMTVDLTQATDEQLERIANGEDPMQVLGNDAITQVRDDAF